jgi:hypothetical protein
VCSGDAKESLGVRVRGVEVRKWAVERRWRVCFGLGLGCLRFLASVQRPATSPRAANHQIQHRCRPSAAHHAHPIPHLVPPISSQPSYSTSIAASRPRLLHTAPWRCSEAAAEMTRHVIGTRPHLRPSTAPARRAPSRPTTCVLVAVASALRPLCHPRRPLCHASRASRARPPAKWLLNHVTKWGCDGQSRFPGKS